MGAAVVNPARSEAPDRAAIRRASRQLDEDRDARRTRPEERSRLPLLIALVPALSVAGLIAAGAWMAAGGSPNLPALFRILEEWRPGLRGESSPTGPAPEVGPSSGDSGLGNGSGSTLDDAPSPETGEPIEEGATDSGRSPAAIPSDSGDTGEAGPPTIEEGPAVEGGVEPEVLPAPVGIPDPLDPREFDLPPTSEAPLDGTADSQSSLPPGSVDSADDPDDPADAAIADLSPRTEDDEDGTLVRGQVPVDPTSPTDVLMAFLRARGVDEMLAHVHDAERIAPAMRQYYKLGPPVPPSVDSVSLEITGTIPGTQLATHVFAITLVDGHEFPVSVEEGEGGFRVDWEGYVQCKDRLLARFLIERPDEARQFYAILRRTHYFGDDVQSLGGKVCFRVMSPLEGDDGSYAFAEREGPFFDAMADMMQWGGVYFPVVELQWVKSPTIGEPYVRLNRVVRQSWRGR